MPRLTVAAKLAGILVAFVAAPVVLYAVAGNPLPDWPIDWGLVSESLSTGAIATSTWLKVIAVGAWLVWAYLSVAVVMELAATVRGRPSRVRVSAVQWLASTIVALATQIATVDASATAVVPVYNAAAVQGGAGGAAAVDPSPGPVDDGARLIVATEGDSWAGFAASAVGDPAAGAVIRAFNQGRDVGGHVVDGSEAFVEAGWQLAIPAEATTMAVGINGATDDDADGSEGATQPTAETAAPTTWTVQEGEHFWDIAERSLADARGRTPTDDELAPYWEQFIEINRDRLAPPGDPDLIYPGQQFIVPPTPTIDNTPAETPDTALVPPGDASAGPAHAAPHAPSDDLPHCGDLQADTRDDHDSEPAQTIEAPPAAADVHGPEETDDGLDDPAVDVRDQDEHADGVETELTRWGVPVGLTTGTTATMLLAGGVLGLLRRRRRLALQQRRVQVRLPPLTRDQLDQAGRLEAAAPPGEVLDELADLLCSIPAAAVPVLVEVADDGSVGLIFDPDQAVTPPPAPWAAHDDPAIEQPQWIATLGARGPRRSIGLPLLVTLGRHQSTTILANIDAMRLLVVTADDPFSGQRRLRAFTLEAATSATSGPLEVTVAGDPGWSGVKPVRLIADPAAEVAAAADEVAQSIIADDRLPRLIVCHDPADVPDLPDGVDLVGVIAADTPGSGARWRLHLDETSGVLHRPDDVEIVLDPPDFDPDLVTGELAALDDSDLPHAAAASPADSPDDLTATADGSSSPEEQGAEPPDEVRTERGWCEVGLLGRITVTCGDTQLDTLNNVVGHVLVYLATHPDTTAELLDDAVWAGQAAGSGHRVRSALQRLRSDLGTSPDGEPLLPRRAPREQTIRLSREVTSDLDRAFAHLDAADRADGQERLDLLLAALDLVRGAPFEDMPVSWATDIAHHAVARLQDAALHAANGLRAVGRLDDAEHAVMQGLKLCDPCEPLYVVWAQIEDARDCRHRIPQLWTRLRQRYADEADETFDVPTAPAADTERAFAALTGRADTQ